MHIFIKKLCSHLMFSDDKGTKCIVETAVTHPGCYIYCVHTQQSDQAAVGYKCVCVCVCT